MLEVSFPQEFKTPIDYLDFTTKEADIISKSFWKYSSDGFV